MIKEDFVSFEVAKLLKEKGFNEPCKVWYSEYTSQFGDEKYTSIEFDDHNRFKKDYKFLFHAPTHQMAMKWLREKGIYITIVYGDYPSLNKIFWTPQIDSLEGFDLPNSFYEEYDKYEEAVEAALKYCLKNLI